MSGGPIRMAGPAAHKVRAADVMSTPVLAVTVDATLERAGEVLGRNGFTTLPVVDEHGRLCGLITEEALAGAHLARLSMYADLPLVTAIRRPLTVRAVALPPVALDADAELFDIARAMLQMRLRSVPVVRDGRPIGIVSWRNILPVLER
ncbi:HPP family protein [Rhodococcus aetherivorans]|uniref:CBS domain-containing protein n=1 Tax=Rhodococcus aetherivorans TaxID=191292 RepID=UPI00366DD773